MKIKPEEISKILQNEITNLDVKIVLKEIGYVLQVGDGIARIYGLENVMAGEMIKFKNNIFGLVLNLEENYIGAVILGNSKEIKEGDEVTRTNKIMSVPVGDALLGRVIDPLGNPLDELGSLELTATKPLERVAPGICDRQPIKEPLETGIKCIDAMIPIGRGQRELIIGDRQTGKTSLAIDTIINQKNSDVICIYVAIGQKKSSVGKIIQTLKEHDALKHTIVVSASASESATMQYIAPFAGCSIGEYFMDKGGAVLIVYDDLSKHAAAYRQLSLLLRRPPGREAFPGDIFYLHSRLLERSLKYTEAKGNGSLTALPIIETQAGDISAYIPTNVISITDGQIYLEPDLFNAGIKPAINPGISVSRVGGNAQNKAMKQVSSSLRLELSQYWEIEAFTKFGSDLDKTTQAQLARGKRLIEILKQNQYSALSTALQTAIIYSAVNNFLDNISLENIKSFEIELISILNLEYSSLLAEITEKKFLDPYLKTKLEEAIKKIQVLF